ncbi:hypothetical protein [Nocardioides sp. LML1-1-1.1]|uniref:hypothetical protein n=1 Tax=Nocardioides sp. LML1-1-1.1 TaxID=3135248 RepID=UPI003436CEF9
MSSLGRRRVLLPLLIAVGLLAGLAGGGAHAEAPDHLPAAGDVVRVESLPEASWVPGVTAAAYRLTYVTTDTFGRPATSTGAVFVPQGTVPAGGWPVLAWAHGTTGLADTCAPSASPAMFTPTSRAYLRTWMEQGYAVVASDYAGLGTPGPHAYLDAEAAAHNVVDMVRAGHAFGAGLPPGQRLSNRWVALGQSQGAGAAIATARQATALGGPTLSYLGAVGTGTPAYIDRLLLAFGPGLPPVPVLPDKMTAYLAYLLASLDTARPALRLDTFLTARGRDALAKARTLCLDDLAAAVHGHGIGEWLTRPLVAVPGFAATVVDYLGMPVTGFDRPLFLGHGLLDVDVPVPATAAYVATLTLTGQPVTFRTYPTDHRGTMTAALQDSVPFVARLFAG